MHQLFIGTYTKGDSRGIYTARLDPSSGTLSEPFLAAEAANPTFLALAPRKNFLYAVSEAPTLAVGFAVDASGKLTPLETPPLSGGKAASHIAVDHTGRALCVAHYGDGLVATLPIRPDGSLGQPRAIRHEGRGFDPKRQTSPHPHSVTISPDNRFALVCDLGLDKIFSYALEPAAAQLTPGQPPFIITAPGAGPRHAAFSPDGCHVYVINEMGGTLSAYAYDAACGSLSHLSTQSTLPAAFTGDNTTAEVRVHPSGRFVYGSNRGHDSIAVFARNPQTGGLVPLEIVPCGGEHPRNFALSPDGAWLVCAHMNSDTLTVFRVDPSSGRLARIGGTVRVPMPVCVLFYD